MSFPHNTINSWIVTSTADVLIKLRPAIICAGEPVKCVPAGNGMKYVVSSDIYDTIIAPMIVSARVAHAEEIFIHSVSSIMKRVKDESAKCGQQMTCKIQCEGLVGTNYVHVANGIVIVMTTCTSGARWLHSYMINNERHAVEYKNSDHEFLARVFAAMSEEKLEWVPFNIAKRAYVVRTLKFD